MRVIDRNDVSEVREDRISGARLYCMKVVKLELQVLKLVYAVRDTI